MDLNMQGKKDILGIWIGESEVDKVWLSVCNAIKIEGQSYFNSLYGWFKRFIQSD